MHRATLEASPQARAGLLPQVDIRSDITRNLQSITQDVAITSGDFDPTPEFWSYGYTLNLTQPVYRHDRWVQLRQADSRIGEAEADVAAARQDLMVRVSEGYFNVLAAMDNLEFAKAEKTALEQQLEQAKERFDVGLIAITDVQEAQAGYDLAVAQEIQAENELDNAREALREITGEYHPELSLLGEPIPLVSPEPADIELWTRKSLEQNLRISSAQFAMETARKEIERQRAGHWPTLDLVGSHGTAVTGGGRLGTFEVEDTQIGLALTVPIYQGGFVSSKTREAQHLYQQSLEELEQERRAAHRQIRESYLGVVAGISQVNAYRQAVVSNETAVQSTQAGFEVGTRTAVDVVTSERELFRARRDYARARYDYILDTLRLKQAAGTLSLEDLVKINSWLGSSGPS